MGRETKSQGPTANPRRQISNPYRKKSTPCRMANEKMIDQNTALKSIYEKMYFLWPPTMLINKVPKMGEKIMGVRKATPKSPFAEIVGHG